MASFESKTYLRVNRQFVPLETFEGVVEDSDYVDGAIELTISGTPILTKSQWDLVDQLWAYIVNGALEIARGANFETGFPDGPSLLRFTLDGDLVTVYVRAPCEESATLPRHEFLSHIASAATPVFTKLLEVIPENRMGYEHVLGQIRELRSYLADGRY